MTITIQAGNAAATDFFTYLDDFDSGFTSAGYGTFSDGLSGDYASAESEIGETGELDAQAYILRGDIAYNIMTHVVTGTVSGIDLGYGATSTAGNSGYDLDVEQLDFAITFDPIVDDEDTAHNLIYAFFGVEIADTLTSLLRSDSIEFVGNDGDDVFRSFQNADTLEGGAGDDTLNGGAGADDLMGGEDDDILLGSRGEDDLSGGDGVDRLNGGDHNDVLNGGADNDRLTGGEGFDDFVFEGDWGRDTIVDFTSLQDEIDLSGATGEATTLAEFLDASRQVGDRVVYDMGNDGENQIVFLDTDLSDFRVGDFIF